MGTGTGGTVSEHDRMHPRPVAAGFDVTKDQVPTTGTADSDAEFERVNGRTRGGLVTDESTKDDAKATKESAAKKAELAGDARKARVTRATSKAEEVVDEPKDAPAKGKTKKK